MFGLSVREVLSKTIRQVCDKELYHYREEIQTICENHAAGKPVNTAKAAIHAQKVYFNAVFDDIAASFRASAPAIEARFRLIFWSPGITGLPPDVTVEYLDDNGISAGSTYAFCYYAFTGKQINPKKDFKIMSSLNHYQNDLMSQVLAALQEEQSREEDT